MQCVQRLLYQFDELFSLHLTFLGWTEGRQLQKTIRGLTVEKHCRWQLNSPGGVMDILAALKTEESRLQQQLDNVHAAMKIVIDEDNRQARKGKR